MASLQRMLCYLRKTHCYENFGEPVPVWNADARAFQGAYRQVRRCRHCGDTYNTFAGFIDGREQAPAASARSAARTSRLT